MFMYDDMVELPESCGLVIGAHAGLVTCERDWSWAPPPLPDYDLWIVLGGEGWLTVNGATFDLAAGASFVFQPGSIVQGAHSPVHRLRVFFCHFRVIHANGEIMRRREGWSSDMVGLHDLPRIEMLGAMLLQGLERADPIGMRTAELALRQILLQRMLDARTPRRPPPDARIARVLDAMQFAPEASWSLAALAEVAHLSVSQLRRLFFAATGVTPNAYLVQERVTRARKLLAESDLPLAAIADTLGYRDVYYFNRQFRQAMGTPPAAYRRIVTCVLRQ